MWLIVRVRFYLQSQPTTQTDNSTDNKHESCARKIQPAGSVVSE